MSETEIESQPETEEVPLESSNSSERVKIKTVYVDRDLDQEDDDEKEYKDRMIIRSYSSMILLIPSFITALICGIVQMSIDLTRPLPYEEASVGSGYGNIIGIVFLVIFSLNLILVAFDFNKARTIIIAILIVAVVAIILLVNAYTGFLTSGGGGGSSVEISIYLSYWVYYIIAALLLFILGFTVLGAVFNYYIVEGNELIHHKGFGSGVERWPASNMSVVKEFPDLIELLIFRSGTLVLTPPRSERSIVLKNVIGINKKIKEMNEILSRLKVDIN